MGEVLVLTMAFTLNLSHSYRNPSLRLHSEFHEASAKSRKERKRKECKVSKVQTSPGCLREDSRLLLGDLWTTGPFTSTAALHKEIQERDPEKSGLDLS